MPTLLITGANRGLGLEFVRQYLAEGFEIYATCRDPSKAKELRALAQKHDKLHIEPLVVTEASSIEALATKLEATPIDLLINNAGIFSGSDNAHSAADKDDSQEFGTIDPKAWEKVLVANTIAPIMVLQSFVPHLKKGKDPKAINITSKMGSLDEMGSGYIAYRSSKTALNAALRVISSTLRSEKVAVLNLHPGWVQTDMGGKSATLTPEVSITGMRKVIAGLTLKTTGQFIGYDGKIIPW